MKIIVLNCGSSSVKYQLFEMPDQDVLAKGVVEKIGLKGAGIKHTKKDGTELNLEGEILDHQQAIEYLLGILSDKKYGSVNDLKEIDAVGHRVVHAGEKFNGSVKITGDVIKALEETIELAPLHNPPNLEGIYACQNLLPGVPMAGVFDTAFHQTMKPHVYLYGIPYSLYEKHGIRRYGFHGTSHRYVSQRAAELLNLDIYNSKLITCHLGNGASITAVQNGKSVDTSMGLTPLEGLIMGTRSGDLDVGALLAIADKEELSISVSNKLLNKHAGVLGVSGVSSDMREIEEAAEEGNRRAELALQMYHYRAKKYIGSYIASMNGADAIVFTGGVGENADTTRRDMLKDMEYLGIKVDDKKNKGLRGKEQVISAEDSSVKVIVVPTNEELVIASDTYGIVTGEETKV
ncbi:MAG: acetate kinase [Bacteroidales bacterium]|nr:acetate kinase [Bacteroidales bacterium]MCF8337092.1 acetate kinase [Bacteroidales bacterium]